MWLRASSGVVRYRDRQGSPLWRVRHTNVVGSSGPDRQTTAFTPQQHDAAAAHGLLDQRRRGSPTPGVHPRRPGPTPGVWGVLQQTARTSWRQRPASSWGPAQREPPRAVVKTAVVRARRTILFRPAALLGPRTRLTLAARLPIGRDDRRRAHPQCYETLPEIATHSRLRTLVGYRLAHFSGPSG